MVCFNSIKNYIMKPNCFITVISSKIIFKNPQRCLLSAIYFKCKL